MPPRAWTARPRIYCSDGCRDQAAAIRQEERWRRELERYRAEQEALRKAGTRKPLDVRNVSTGGRSRREAQSQANARWERLYEETLDATGSRWGLCQWEDEDANGDYLGRRCTRRTAGVYCGRHNRQLERESERRRREKERASTSFPTPTIQKE
jgi:hypothetical protein